MKQKIEFTEIDGFIVIDKWERNIITLLSFNDYQIIFFEDFSQPSVLVLIVAIIGRIIVALQQRVIYNFYELVIFLRYSLFLQVLTR